MTYYNICKGAFVPRRADTGRFYTIGQKDQEIYADLLYGKHKLICINDNPTDLENLEKTKHDLILIFEKKFPEKSSFER